MLTPTSHLVTLASLMLCTVTASLAQPASAADLGPAKEIVFKARIDGTDQKYMERVPADFDPLKPHAVLIALHGHGSDRNQGVSDRPEFKAAQDAAARHDMVYIAPDYRTNSWMSALAESDVVQIIGDLKTKYKVTKVFLTGASMGGTSALTFTAVHPDLIDGVCSQNGTANLFDLETTTAGIQDAIKAAYGGTKAEVPREYKKRSAEYWPERFTMPVAIQAGGKDTVVPPDSVVRLAGVLKKMARPVQLNFRPDGGHDTSYADVTAALDWVIATAGKPVAAIPSVAPPAAAEPAK